MKNFIIGFIIVIIAVLALNSDFLGNKKIKTFSVTADTNVSQVKGLSKYVSQEEVDSFAFRHWDIDDDKVMNNEKMENLRLLLKSKNTQEILNFMSDNNISVDEPLHYGVTALMYASFYNDIETAKELINLGADPHKKDRYKLSPMAYAIENNATKSVKLLLENGVKFDEVEVVQGYLLGNNIHHDSYIKSIIVENDKLTIEYKYKDDDKISVLNDGRFSTVAHYFFELIVDRNQIDLAKIVLESGYRPKNYNVFDAFYNIVTIDDDIEKAIGKEKFERAINDEIRSNGKTSGFNLELYIDRKKYGNSLYYPLQMYSNYKPMLDLLLKYNIGGQPSEKLIKTTYDECYRKYIDYIVWKFDYIHDMQLGRDDNIVFGHGVNKQNITPFVINQDRIEEYNNNIQFYEKHCGSKEFTENSQKEFEKIFKSGSEYWRLTSKFQDEMLNKNAGTTFENLEKFLDYKNELKFLEAYRRFVYYSPDKVFLKDKNMTHKDYFLKKFETMDIATTSMQDIMWLADTARVKFINEYDPKYQKLLKERKKFHKN